jgi:hypothetical protein
MTPNDVLLRVNLPFPQHQQAVVVSEKGHGKRNLDFSLGLGTMLVPEKISLERAQWINHVSGMLLGPSDDYPETPRSQVSWKRRLTRTEVRAHSSSILSLDELAGARACPDHETLVIGL